MKQIIDAKETIEADKLAAKFSKLSENDQRLVFNTVNCMLMLQKAREAEQKKGA